MGGDKIKFIFPQNYNFNYKIFGLIDYGAAFLDIVWGILIFLIVNILFKSIMTKIFIFIIFVFPILIFSIVGVQGENLIDFIRYIIKYFISQKVYLYNKKTN